MTTPITVRQRSAPFLALVGLLCSTAAMSQICTREFAPVCGQVAGQTTHQTFPNRCMLNAAHAKPLHEGACQAMPTPPAQDASANALAEPARPITGSGVDAHGCIPSAGYTWNAELASCVRPWMTSVITLQVAALQRPCKGQAAKTCLQVRELQTGKAPSPWRTLNAEIEGFQPTPGKRQKLRVRKDLVEDAPAGAPDTRYTLLKVL